MTTRVMMKKMRVIVRVVVRVVRMTTTGMMKRMTMLIAGYDENE